MDNNSFRKKRKSKRWTNRGRKAEVPTEMATARDVKSKESKSKSKPEEKVEKNVVTEDEASVNKKDADKEKKKTSKGAAKAKAPAPLAAPVESAVATFVANTCDTSIESLQEEFRRLSEVVPAAEAVQKCSQHADKNRYTDFPCLDDTRIELKPPMDGKAGDPDYIHANRVNLDKTERPFIATQGPLESTREEFWRMIFQETCPAIMLLCPFYEDGAQKCSEFWPLETGAFKYYGRMFVNNKKVEHADQYTVYTLEILPEGCSNSLITRLAHCTTWPDNGIASSGRVVLRLNKWLKSVEAGPVTVVSSAGVGRAGTYILIEAVISRLFKGNETKVHELAQSLRKQRALSISNEIQYLFVYSTVLEYIKLKIPKHNASVGKFFASLKAA